MSIATSTLIIFELYILDYFIAVRMVDFVALGYDVAFQEVQTKWHQDEVNFREEEKYRREIEDARRAANEMAEQLKVSFYRVECYMC